MICREVAILLANIFKLPSSRVDDLDVTGYIFVSPDLAEIVEAKLAQNL
jgi:hypothetical protein